MSDDTAAREAIMLAVDAYDAARLAHHGQSAEWGMSEANKRALAPMIQAAIDAYLTAFRSFPNATLADAHAEIARLRAAFESLGRHYSISLSERINLQDRNAALEAASREGKR